MINVLMIDVSDYTCPSNCVFTDYASDLDFSKEYDLAILNRNVSWQEAKQLVSWIRSYTLFVDDQLVLSDASMWLCESRQAKIMTRSDIQKLLTEDSRYYFSKPYGEKFNPRNMVVSSSFTGDLFWEGFSRITLSGNFGDDYEQVAFWKNNIPIFPGQSIEFWLEYLKSGCVDIRLQIVQFVSGTISMEETRWIFDEKDLENLVVIENSDQNRTGSLFVSIYARGEGSLNIIGLHDRYSRNGHGSFLPGGQRSITSTREEVFHYLDKGDLKPPLNVYFSGYKTMEGFEGYRMMRNIGAPFLLISESRLEGGSFYIGDKEFESMVASAIQKALDALHFTSDDLVLSGLSMGTFGALYYGCYFQPRAILLGKPLASIGDVANNERLNRPKGFPTSLDVLYKNCGDLSSKSIKKLNDKFWSRFNDADFSKTTFVISYMYEDDYDQNAYQKLLSSLSDVGVSVYGKGLHGRHNDETQGIISWFVLQYKNLMCNMFERKRNR